MRWRVRNGLHIPLDTQRKIALLYFWPAAVSFSLCFKHPELWGHGHYDFTFVQALKQISFMHNGEICHVSFWIQEDLSFVPDLNQTETLTWCSSWRRTLFFTKERRMHDTWASCHSSCSSKMHHRM